MLLRQVKPQAMQEEEEDVNDERLLDDDSEGQLLKGLGW